MLRVKKIHSQQAQICPVLLGKIRRHKNTRCEPFDDEYQSRVARWQQGNQVDPEGREMRLFYRPLRSTAIE